MIDHVHAVIREAWYLASNRRVSGYWRGWTTEPTIHAVCVQSIEVEEAHRRQGLCKAFLQALIADERFEMVEAVNNTILAEALMRWGWSVDAGVSDYYHKGGLVNG